MQDAQAKPFHARVYNESLSILSHLENLKTNLATYRFQQDGLAEISPLAYAFDVLSESMTTLCMWGKTCIQIGHTQHNAQEVHDLLVIAHNAFKITEAAQKDRDSIAKVYYPVAEDRLLHTVLDAMFTEISHLTTLILYQKGISPSDAPGPCLPLIKP